MWAGTQAEREAMILEEESERIIGGHVRMAHVTVRGEHQISEYVARLEIVESARILAAAPEGLPRLAPQGPVPSPCWLKV